MEQVKKHEKRYNNTAKTVLKFKSPIRLYQNTSQSVIYALTTKKKSIRKVTECLILL